MKCNIMTFIRFYSSSGDWICNFNLICLSLKLVLKCQSRDLLAVSIHLILHWRFKKILYCISIYLVRFLSSKLERKTAANFMLCILPWLHNLWVWGNETTKYSYLYHWCRSPLVFATTKGILSLHSTAVFAHNMSASIGKCNIQWSLTGSFHAKSIVMTKIFYLEVTTFQGKPLFIWWNHSHFGWIELFP